MSRHALELLVLGGMLASRRFADEVIDSTGTGSFSKYRHVFAALEKHRNGDPDAARQALNDTFGPLLPEASSLAGSVLATMKEHAKREDIQKRSSHIEMFSRLHTAGQVLDEIKRLFPELSDAGVAAGLQSDGDAQG
jgi:hypothetical protein